MSWHRLDIVSRLISRLATVLAGIGFIVVTLAFLWTVFCRFVLQAPSAISEEVAIATYLWVMMIGASLAVGLRQHVSFDLLTAFLPPRAGRAVAALGALAAGALLLATLPETLDYIAFLWREKTPVMRLPLNWLYLCFALMQGALGLKLLAQAVQLALPASDDPDEGRAA